VDNREGDRRTGGTDGARPTPPTTADNGGGHRYWYADPAAAEPEVDVYIEVNTDRAGDAQRDDPGWTSPMTRVGDRPARHASPPPADPRRVPPVDGPRHGARTDASEALSFDDLPTAVHPRTPPRRPVAPRFVEGAPPPDRRTGRHQAPGPATDDPYPLSRPTTGHLREQAELSRDQPITRGAHTAETPRVTGEYPTDPALGHTLGESPPQTGRRPDDFRRPGSAMDDSWPRAGADDSWPRRSAPDDSWPRGGAIDDSWPRAGADDSWPRGARENWPRRGSEIAPLAIDGGREDRALPPGRGGRSGTGTELVRRPARAVGASAQGDPADEDRDYPAVMWWTAIWYAVPALSYALWTLTLSSALPAGCTATTPDCVSLRGQAVTAGTDHIVGVLLAAVLSFGVAWCVRRITLSWRAISVGFAAAVVGAGLATMIGSVIG
jgi:hypothetical protein